MQDYERAAIDFAVKLAALAITVKCEFVPQSLSRNAGEKALSLNWRVAVLKDGRPIRGIENVDYMQGIGHAPSHNSPPKFTDGRPDKWRQGEYAKIEAEQGKRAAISTLTGNGYAIASQPLPPPSASDVLFSLSAAARPYSPATCKSASTQSITLLTVQTSAGSRQSRNAMQRARRQPTSMKSA